MNSYSSEDVPPRNDSNHFMHRVTLSLVAKSTYHSYTACKNIKIITFNTQTLQSLKSWRPLRPTLCKLWYSYNLTSLNLRLLWQGYDYNLSCKVSNSNHSLQMLEKKHILYKVYRTIKIKNKLYFDRDHG